MQATIGSHRYQLTVLFAAIGILFAVVGAATADDPNVAPFPTRGLLPKEETGALRFLELHPEYDGRRITVAVFDTGVDPGAAGLSSTSTGQPKFVDLIDATGDGDVILADEQPAQDGKLTGLSGRTLTVSPQWTNRSGTYRRGLKQAYELFPAELVKRLKKERREKWNLHQATRAAELRQQLITWDDIHPKPTAEQFKDRDELQARIDVHAAAQDRYDDPGPIYDCVVWNDGKNRRTIVDTDEDGDLADERPLTDYRKEHEFATFSDASQLNFSVNFYDDGDVLSLVTTSGSHGTHVAGIVAAYEPDHPERNGIAPGAQLVSVKIGDNRVEGMETGRALVRGLRAALDRNCDLINMSYGEPSSVPNGGRLPDLMSELVREHGVIFVSSAGNSGPALSTVGAPGGTTDALLGIGAYVSPAMMSPQYGLREKLAGMPYNWTSRGPTTDGAMGIDLFAPGGAFAPVSEYSLQKTMQMNGTSMASPNACGDIALLLSGLKAEQKTYTPALIRRSLENSAKALPGIDRFAQGAGLIQTDAAWDWLEQHAEPAERISFRIETDSNHGRGIVLRESEHMPRPFRTRVLLTPQFRRDEAKQTQVDLELPVTLESTADWIDASDTMLITSGGARFDLRVDPSGLSAGAHTVEVRGYQAGHEKRGPLFRVPVTVIRPDAVTKEASSHFVMNPGDTQRRFLTVPEGATWADITLTVNEAESRRTFILHTVQTLPGHSFEDHERREYVKLERGDRTVVSIPVVDDETLEVCLSQYWTYLGSSHIDMNVAFRGLLPDDDDIVIPSDGAVREIRVTASIRRERCRPIGSLRTIRRLLRPEVASVTPLLTPRERQLDGGPSSRLETKYSFELKDSGEVTIRVPELDGLLYDSPVESHSWQLFDANERLVATRDTFPDESGRDELQLDEGRYTVRLELRHADPAVLNEFESILLAVDADLSQPIPIQSFKSRTDAITASAKFQAVWLDPGDNTTVCISIPETPSPESPLSAEAGDNLLGSMTFVGTPDGDAGADARPEGFPVRFVIPPKSAAVETPPQAVHEDDTPLVKQLASDLLDERIAQLDGLQWPQDKDLLNSLSAEIESDHPDATRRLLVAKLKLIDGDNRKEHLPDVIAAAAAVIATVNSNQLARRLLFRANPDRPKAVQRKAEAEERRDILVDALYRKGRALAYRELPDVVEKHPIEDQPALDREFETNFQQLCLWVDTTDPEYALLHIRRDRRAKRYGLALQQLNKLATTSTPSKWLHHKKRRDLYELLGWDDWREYEQKQMLIRFPDEPAS